MAKEVKYSINLLPFDLLKGSALAKFVEGVKTVSLVGSVVLVIAIFAVGSTIIINTNKLTILANEKEKLIAQVEDLNQEEQLHFIVQDRAKQILAIKEESAATNKEIDNLNRLVDSFPESGDITTLDMSGRGLVASFNLTSSRVFLQVLDLLVNRDLFTKVVLNSLNLSPTLGYQTEFNLSSSEE